MLEHKHKYQLEAIEAIEKVLKKKPEIDEVSMKLILDRKGYSYDKLLGKCG